MTTSLKPCPKCKSTPLVYRPRVGGYSISCPVNSCGAGQKEASPTEQLAAGRWNRWVDEQEANKPAGRYPPLPIGYVPRPRVDLASEMTMRQYYAASCPMTLEEAHKIWAGETWDEGGNLRRRDSLYSSALKDGAERIAFFEWWAQMRFEYADAMIKEEKSNG